MKMRRKMIARRTQWDQSSRYRRGRIQRMLNWFIFCSFRLSFAAVLLTEVFTCVFSATLNAPSLSFKPPQNFLGIVHAVCVYYFRSLASLSLCLSCAANRWSIRWNVNGFFCCCCACVVVNENIGSNSKFASFYAFTTATPELSRQQVVWALSSSSHDWQVRHNIGRNLCWGKLRLQKLIISSANLRMHSNWEEIA